MTPPDLEAGSALGATENCTLPGPCPADPAVMLIHVTSGCALHWHSRSVETVIVPPPPVAGTVEPGLSTVTAHLDRLEGEVIVFPDEPHPVTPMAQANSAVTAEKLRDLVAACRLRMAANGCGGRREELPSRCLPTVARPYGNGI